ncbi:sulfatase [Rubellimicrobium arenae]|uniref:sulfatase n=1 Tax=Rubellimicrobium arenae TaxID=2817372 RepID=UPI001B30539B|nr:sulfatase [Rubellimicrobium arenae]
MKCVFVLFDSLNRHMLGAYGGTRVPTPNFDRLAARTRVYDRHYVGSLPCMPARRDLLTGRLTFLHRSWGPLEPFDNAFPEILKAKGVHSHLVTDHYHYWEDGGATYHNRYSTFEFVRGQESDPWKAMVQPPWERLREKYHERQMVASAQVDPLEASGAANKYGPYVINREFIREEKDFPSVQCFAHGFDFLDMNRDANNWLLQIETFDPHEPFFAPDRFKEPFRTGWNGPIRDWPRYGRVEELPEEAEELRANYYAVVALCDELLGRLLDYFDEHDLWKDTALVVTTDHGFLLGEHDFWAKNRMNMYEEIVHIPLMIHDPRDPRAERVDRLTQSVDVAPTMLDLFDAEAPAETQGMSLLGKERRDAVIFGYFGGAVNVTDGQLTYHRFPADVRDQEIYQYTLMPTHITSRFTPEELKGATLAPPFGWTKEAPLLKVPVIQRSPMYDNYGPGCLLENDTRLYDLARDPGQEQPLADPELEGRMVAAMTRLMRSTEAPPEAFARLGLAES